MIKVADFGLTEDMYGTNYFRRRKSETGSEEKVPIRWMAPESIEDEVYNESSDVVSTILYMYSCMSYPISPMIYFCVVVIRCDSLGDIHLWEGPLLWSTSHESTEATTERPETGETRQCNMCGRNVSSKVCLCIFVIS